MNVAYLHWGFPPIIGGVETHLAILLPELKKSGCNVALLTGSVDDMPARHTYEGVGIFRSPLFDLNWLAKRGVDSLEDEITRLYDEFFEYSKPDVIHAHNMHYFSMIHAVLLDSYAKAKGIPLILTAHNVWDDINFLKMTRNIGWDHIIAVSHYIKKELIGIGCEASDITVVYHGIDTKRFHPGKPSDLIFSKHPELKDKKIVFHPARMGIAKGCDVSIKAINVVREKIPDVMLVLGGTKNIIDWNETQQKDIAYFIDLIKIFRLENNVYIDFFSLDQMPELYRLADVCIYPSTAAEPFGLTMLEALASAKPMIVSNMGGMPEIIRDDIDGYVVKVKDHEALASRITQLLLDESLRKRLGNAGRETVCEQYSKEIMAKTHKSLYEQILGSKISVKNSC